MRVSRAGVAAVPGRSVRLPSAFRAAAPGRKIDGRSRGSGGGGAVFSGFSAMSPRAGACGFGGGGATGFSGRSALMGRSMRIDAGGGLERAMAGGRLLHLARRRRFARRCRFTCWRGLTRLHNFAGGGRRGRSLLRRRCRRWHRSRNGRQRLADERERSLQVVEELGLEIVREIGRRAGPSVGSRHCLSLRDRTAIEGRPPRNDARQLDKRVTLRAGGVCGFRSASGLTETLGS